MPQPQPRHQSRLNDIQMLQRQIMIKKLQELQRQQQVQELGDGRQHNYINQQYALNKQISAEQFPPLINGTPISDASQRFMMGNINLMHPGAPQIVQGFSNGTGFPQNQGQALSSMSLVSPQLDVSLYGTPVPGVGNNLGRYSQLLGASQGSENSFEKGSNNQQDETITHSSIYSNSLGTYNCDASNQIGMQEGALVSVGDFQEKNLFGQVPAQALHGNFQQMNTLRRSSSPMEVGGRQEQAGWPGQFAGKATNMGPSQDLCSLDPLEQKILFNTDDNSWDASFGSSCNISSDFLKNTSENTDHASAFPSLQSGSWSALMQSAVAETSSGDAGIQEEWSGLSFQNPELSTDNRSSKFIESGKQQPDWVENGLQTVSALNSKPEPNFKNLNMASSFPGFQQPGIQFSLKQKDELHLETSRESNQQHSPKVNKQWLDCNSLQKQTNEVNQPGERHSSLQNAWPGPNYEHSKSNAYRESIPMYTKGMQAGDISGLEQARSGNVNTNHPFTESNKLPYGNDTDGSVEDARREYVRNNQYHRSSSPQINNAYNGASRTYEKQQCIERENSNDSYHSNASQHTISGHELKQNVWQHKSDSSHFADSSQRPSDQVMYQQIPQGSHGYELGYAEQFKYSNVSSSDSDLAKRHLLSNQKNSAEHVSPRNHDNTSAFFDTSVVHEPNMTPQTSHMLELLYKVDKSKDYRPVVHGGSRDSSPFSEVPQAGSPDAFATQSYNKPMPSQTFGLRLSPPSQQTPAANCFDSSRSSPKMARNGDTGSLGPSFVRNQLQSQHQLAAPVVCQSYEAPVPDVRINQDTPSNSYNQQLSVLEDNSVTQPFVKPGTSHYAGSPMLWKNAPAQRNLSNADPRKGPPSPEVNNNDFVAASTAPQVLNYESIYKGHNETSKSSMSSEGLGFQGEQAPKEAYSQLDSSGTLGPVPQKGKSAYGQVAKGYSETDNVDPGSSMPNSSRQAFVNQSQNISDLEVFGRSLEPSHISPQNYSMQQQVHLANRSGCDSVSDHSVQQSNANTGQQLYGNSSGIQDAGNNELISMSHSSFHPNGERKLHNLSSEIRENQLAKTLSQPLLGDANQETLTFGQYSSPYASDASEQSQISLQMAPSWFKHYGTLRNGQMLPMFDPRAAHQFSTGNILEKLRMGGPGAGHESSVWPTTTDNNLVAVKSLTPSYVLPPNVLVQNPEIVRPKKRKAFELLPWHKEISQCSQNLHNASLSDLEWVEATNRRIEKVEDEVATIEDSTFLRPKKRLVSTTQLMQQLFRPPPGVIFGGNATLNCEILAFFAARLALGHSCCLKNSPMLLCDMPDKSREKLRTPKQIGDQESVKVVEDFLTRSTKLEANFLMLEKSASIADIRVESQELEKFSMINHFAKFHTRGPAGVAEASTSSGVKRMFLQRYVKPVPMPRTVPEDAQCLSL